jgi:hypothetical protein
MSDEVDEFIYRRIHDIERFLRDRLESLKDDLDSDDAATKARATREADQILDWLLPSMPPLPAQERARRATAAASDPTLTEEQKLVAVRRFARSTGRRRGRPRDETSQRAIRALSLFYAKGFQPGQVRNQGGAWREIALQVKPCSHRGSTENRSCGPCRDAIRDAAGRLEDFLISIGYQPIP